MNVLVIEDKSSTAGELKRGLLREGFVVTSAIGSNEGDRHARSDDYDVIVVDLTLPKIDGLLLVKQWRKSGLKIPALILIEPGDMASQIQALADLADLGTDDFLTKPVCWEELVVRLRAIHRRNQQSVLRICDLEIDTLSRTVKRGGQVIYLTPREYSLLHFLARRRGKVVTHSQIRATLYQELEENASNVIAVYIRYLRTKIDKGFELPLILTRWGEGYLVRGEAG